MTDAPTSRDSAPSAPVLFRALRLFRFRPMRRSVDQEGVVAKLKEESAFSARYVFMTAMSAGIAVLGLLLSSPAVVIGAMLLSPLMGPILGAGFALAIGDAAWLRSCAKNLAIGTAMAVLFCALIVLLSPLQTVTEEIASRTRPNLFDLLVALFSALAGSYAMVRGREGTIVGVAIATALMPPLAVVGYGLATGNWTVFGGSLMLFVTNLLTIALTAAVMARIYGFRSNLSSRQTMMQTVGIVLSFVILAIPLGASLSQIAWEANASRQANGFIKDQFAPKARISQLDIDYDAEPIRIAATVLTPEFNPDAVTRTRRALERTLGQQVNLSIDQFQVGTDPGAAEAAEIAAARERERAAATEREIAAVGERLALIAGVSPNDVLLDREHRRAMVRARPIDGASLAGYRQLESRVAATAPGWRVELIPPVRSLPAVAFTPEGELSDEGRASASLIAWAAKRLDLPVRLEGPRDAAEKLADELRTQGVQVEIEGAGTTGTVRASWQPPADE